MVNKCLQLDFTHEQSARIIGVVITLSNCLTNYSSTVENYHTQVLQNYHVESTPLNLFIYINSHENKAERILFKVKGKSSRIERVLSILRISGSNQ